MKNILLPTDFSENSWNAITFAIRFFETSTCTFYILHVNRLSYLVTGDIPYVATDQVIEDVYTKPAKIGLRKILKRISGQFPHHENHKFVTITDYNFFTDVVQKIVKEQKIDCIVMGTKGATGLGQHIIGTNTGDVINKIKCTILAIPEKARFTKLTEIAFPTDFLLKCHPDTLQPLLDILKQNKAALRILHIGEKETELSNEQLVNKQSLQDLFKDIPLSFHFLTTKHIEEGIKCFVESRNISMICMIAKNLNYFQQIMFHSKVEEISYHLEIPFLVLRKK